MGTEDQPSLIPTGLTPAALPKTWHVQGLEGLGYEIHGLHLEGIGQRRMGRAHKSQQ